ncbi:hypothetical protein FB451DRAFT_1168290 [Mycena latifolia]|nr:hypothetical protein FB451DRAFT_1168290 [Mycena latifolia]
MPLPPTAAQNRLSNIVTSLNAAVSTLDVLTESLKTPFLQPISNAVHSLLTAVKIIKRNQDECAQMLEQIHRLLYAIILVHIKSDTGGELPPMLLGTLGRFAETLHKVSAFIEAEQEKSKIKQIFRQGEMRTLLKGCHMGLEQTLEVFKATLQMQNVTLLNDVAHMQEHAQKTHQEVLELISAISDGGTSEGGSLISRVLSSSHNRIAILGGGGMGKTSLARAVLHHPKITTRYDQHRVFVVCDAVSSSIQLAALIGAHVGLKTGPDLTEPVVRYFSSRPPSLLILDNMETVWEPKESCIDVEKFLALLDNIDHLALIITMRGAERPANVRWTHPFLEPLKPLGQDAARKTFIDIADDGYAVEDIDKILLLADNMPLAIDLIAHLVDYDGFDSVMHHWETERTSVLSEGHNKGSNLDISISLSLESPRLASVPHAHDLLSLLSMLPDGLADADLVQSKLPIENILACKAALLRTSLAYTDDQKRLKALAPIREYMQKMHPPVPYIVQPLLRHFLQLLEVHDTYHGTVSSPGIESRIALNLANIQNVLIQGLQQDNLDLVKTIYGICHFDLVSRLIGHGQSQLLNQIPRVLPFPRDHRLEVYFMVTALAGHRSHWVPNGKHMIDQALEYFPHFDDPELKCRCYAVFTYYYYSSNRDIPRAIDLAQHGLLFSISTGNIRRQSDLLTILAWMRWTTGDYSAGLEHAYEARRLASISGNLFREAQALRWEAMCWCALGNYDHSIHLANRARALLSVCALSGGTLDDFILNTQADVHLLKSEYIEASSIHTQSLNAAVIQQTPCDQAFALITIAQINVEISALRDGVQRNIDRAKQLFRSVNHSIGYILCDMITGASHANHDGDLLKATHIFQMCLKSFWGNTTEGVTYCLEKLGNASLCLKLKQKLQIHKALQFLGDLYLADGDQQTATSLFTVALEGFTKMDVHRSRAECMLRLGEISELHGDLPEAAELWKTARPLFERSSQTKQVAHIDEQVARMSKLLEHHLEPIIQLSALNAPKTHPDTMNVGEDEIKPSLIPA